MLKACVRKSVNIAYVCVCVCHVSVGVFKVLKGGHQGMTGHIVTNLPNKTATIVRRGCNLHFQSLTFSERPLLAMFDSV